MTVYRLIHKLFWLIIYYVYKEGLSLNENHAVMYCVEKPVQEYDR